MNDQPSRRGEFELIAKLFAPLAQGAPGALGLRDDAALVDVAPGCQLVVTADTVVGGVHFRLDDPPELVARKALRVNLSDLAAKGARPIGFLQAITLNGSIDHSFLERYAAGLAADVAEFGIPLLGGDTTSGPGPFSISITAWGEVEKGRALLRNGAKPGDAIYVTGTIGDGALGLACLEGKLPSVSELVERYHVPQPRLAVGRALLGLASACADISDGLAADIGHICSASGVAGIIERKSIPLSAGARAAVSQDKRWWEKVLAGGDDYELAFTVSPTRASEVAAVAALHKIPLTPVGRIAVGSGVTVLSDDGSPIQLTVPGYRHR